MAWPFSYHKGASNCRILKYVLTRNLFEAILVFFCPDQETVGLGFELELGDHIGSVFLDGSVRNKQHGGDFLVGFIVGNQLKDLFFRWS